LIFCALQGEEEICSLGQSGKKCPLGKNFTVADKITGWNQLQINTDKNLPPFDRLRVTGFVILSDSEESGFYQ
jgi:hypothetical protein